MKLRLWPRKARLNPEDVPEFAANWANGNNKYPSKISPQIAFQIADTLCEKKELARARDFVAASVRRTGFRPINRLHRVFSQMDENDLHAPPAFRFDRTADMQLARKPGGSRKLLVSFLNNAERMFAPSELVHCILAKYDWDILYLADKARHAFLDGVATHPSYEQLVDAINALRSENGYERVMSLGSSTGTFAALLYAPALKSSHILGLAGPTKLSEEYKQIIGVMIEQMRQRPDTGGLHRLDAITDQLHRLSPHIRLYHGALNERDTIAARRVVDAGLGTAFAIKDHHEHNVLYPALEIGILQADLQAASDNRPFVETDQFEHAGRA